MAVISAYDLFVVVTYGSYSDPSGDTDIMYTTKEEAQAECDNTNRIWEKNKSSLKSRVMTLDEWIREAKQRSYYSGQQSEQNSDSW